MASKTPTCPNCGYSLVGLPQDSRGRFRCPECGRIGPLNRRFEAPTNMGAVVAAQIFSWLPAFFYIMFGYSWFGVSTSAAVWHGVALLPVSFVVAAVVTARAAGRVRAGVERVSVIGCFLAWLTFGVGSSLVLGGCLVLLYGAEC